ncbi:hypothetical protein ACED47_23755 [Vibrio splendidus]|uniref:hypothetical protein n=1 Tax=Vibrio splendidus TaxID=29497 RepID=UPI00352D6F3A
MSSRFEVAKATLWDWVKAICTLTVVGVLSYKVYLTPIALTVDFPTLLSLLLALFSVGLAALFYFKATETSNTFYDNTNNFTKNIAQLLAKMESGFGEKLKNLDEGYTSMRDYLQYSASHSKEIDETKQKIEGEKQEIEKVIEERNQIVRNLVDKAQLAEEEKAQIVKQLEDKEIELSSSQNELSKMNKRLFVERMKKKEERNTDHASERGFESFTAEHVIPEIGEDLVLHPRFSVTQRAINSYLDSAPRGYIDDLERRGFFGDGITRNGIRFFREIARQR